MMFVYGGLLQLVANVARKVHAPARVQEKLDNAVARYYGG